MKDECCEKLSEECNSAIAKNKKRVTWLDKRPKTAAALVTYLNNWGDKVLTTKTTNLMYGVHACKKENKNFKTEAECKAADKECCFVCDKIDCGGDMPLISVCKDDEPSAYMKKFGATKCSTSSSVDFNPMNECGACASPRDLFEQYDGGKLSTSAFREDKSGIGSTGGGFYGGMNLHNVLSAVHINDKVCPQPSAGLLISPHNSGTFTMTGKSGTVYAIVGVVNEKSTDPAKGVKLGGAADYLVIGGKTGTIVNVDNKAGAEVTVTNGGTWKLHDVSNAKGGKVILDSDVIEIGGPGTRNDGIVEVKRGKIVAMAKANTGTITFADGVTGTLLLCKDGGTINKGKVKVTIKADDPFCSQTVAKSTKPDPLALAPEFFYCHDSEKYSKVIFNRASAGSEEERCGYILSRFKEYWPVLRREADTADFKRVFATCCAPARKPPKGKIYKLRKTMIKRKVVKAKTTVSIDLTKAENKDKKDKFESAYIKRAKAKTTSKFAYKKKGDSSRRRLAQGTDVTVTLEYDNDTDAEAGKSVVAASGFASGLKEDLKKQGVDTTVTETSASIATVQEEVVEEFLADAPTTTTAVKGGQTKVKGGQTTVKGGQTKAKGGQTTVKGVKTTVKGLKTTFALSMGTSMFSNPIIAFASTLVAIGALF